MPSDKSCKISAQKPVNIFYVWYTELCRRLNSNPAPAVKPAKPKCQTILDFVGDRLKIDDWSPVINALRHDTSLHVISIKSRVGSKCEFLHEVDTEDKARRMKRRYGYIWTAYVLNSLLKSISCTVRNNCVLTCLEFDGIPLFCQYLDPLLRALKKNQTLKSLALTNCRIGDKGCQAVCDYLKYSPNIEVLNLTGCGLTDESGAYLARLIKFQQINRYCESWHNSLRYENPHNHKMLGIKRITLNRNPLFGDCGLSCILDELDDDLWIKALDMQKCGITEKLSGRILDVLEYNQSLEILDFRLNDQLSISTIEQILAILKQKHHHQATEFQWCNTTMSLAYDSILDTNSTTRRNYSTSTISHHPVYKSKSVPINNKLKKPQINEIITAAVRKVNTTDNIPKTTRHLNGVAVSIDQKVRQLNHQLQQEIAKRKETEQLNSQLISALQKCASGIAMKPSSLMNGVVVQKPKNGVIMSAKTKNGDNGAFAHKNGFAHQTNGFVAKASDIFEEILSRGGTDETDNVESDEDTLRSYLNDLNTSTTRRRKKTYRNEMSDSQASLLKFMEKLKGANMNNGGKNGVIERNKYHT